MDALEYFKTKEKMCDVSNGFCEDCPLENCDYLEVRNPEEAVKIVVKWKEENSKTCLSELQKALPNAEDRVIDCIIDSFCPWLVFPNLIKPQECISDCKKCWCSEVER